ncbi:MBL fold metallo-hydrolase [Ramlibacter solisilvae]|uniref:Beta-lactamase n=1 Tax=Ramlibacter tataouinensis TaxID=94132 RepID=A0A127JQW1_9BURK|nr:MBL fold metallo-hydrolase [Ramlibacter tataouinensis]AMO22337.1 beta-lactamase [Ramlibacter tataouinensis]
MSSDVAVADGLEVLVIVDNATDGLSTNPAGVVSEWQGLRERNRLQLLGGTSICCAHHGLSLLLQARRDGEVRSLLFDAGPEGAVFLRNSRILGIDFGAIPDVVLSHGHWDHAGGLTAAIEQIAGARGAGQVGCHVHPGMFAQRGMKLPSGIVFPFEDVPAPGELARAGATVISSRDAHTAGGGLFYISGEIPRTTPYETGLPGHLRRSDDGTGWEPDPLLMDERFVSVHVKDKGQFIFSACSHAGIINVLGHARSLFPQLPLYGAMGGLHLSGSTERIIPDTVADLRQFDLQLLAPGHCTGWRAIGALEQAFAGTVVPLAVGKRFIA